MILREQGACAHYRHFGGNSTRIWIQTRYANTVSTAWIEYPPGYSVDELFPKLACVETECL